MILKCEYIQGVARLFKIEQVRANDVRSFVSVIYKENSDLEQTVHKGG